MSREEAVLLASRSLALLLTLSVLIGLSNLPTEILAFRHYVGHEMTPSSNLEYWQYWRQHYLVELAFTVTRIIGLSLLARWLFKGGPEVAALFLPSTAEEIVESNVQQ